MRAVDLIRKKRDGGELTPPELAWLVDGLLDKSVPEYQWSALLMAIVWRGMTDAETAALTEAMTRSGEVVDLAGIPGLKIDKHSTGGVGDKTSLILAPIAAAVGVPVPMVSGRGLGHTGGTLDKLESIPGFRVNLSLDEYKRVLEHCGLVLIGQTAEIAPADKILYALRDATATVEAVPLIAASIMSKKLAEGIDGLVLDVKTGDGAFMESYSDSKALAETMCAIGRRLGKKMRALITRMDQPLGYAVGNSVEIVESVACLRGDGPEDLVDLSVELAAEMVLMGERATTLDEARVLCRRAIADGSALERLRLVVEAQGGDPSALDDPERLPCPSRHVEVHAPATGYVSLLRARPIGQATVLLGAGRDRVDSQIDHAVHVILFKKLGDYVHAGEPLAAIGLNASARLDEALTLVRNAFTIADEPPSIPPLFLERL